MAPLEGFTGAPKHDTDEEATALLLAAVGLDTNQSRTDRAHPEGPDMSAFAGVESHSSVPTTTADGCAPVRDGSRWTRALGKLPS